MSKSPTLGVYYVDVEGTPFESQKLVTWIEDTENDKPLDCPKPEQPAATNTNNPGQPDDDWAVPDSAQTTGFGVYSVFVCSLAVCLF